MICLFILGGPYDSDHLIGVSGSTVESNNYDHIECWHTGRSNQMYSDSESDTH